MTTIPGRSRSALLVVDVQRGVVRNALRRDEVVANAGALVARARAQSAPVVWVQHADEELVEGTPDWELVPELDPRDDEPIVHKHYGDAFEGTDLEAVLADRQVARLVIAGAQTDACIRSTLHGGAARGYDVTLVEDAHTTDDLRAWGSPIGPDEAIAYTNLYWRFSSAPGRTLTVTPAAEVDFAPSA